MSIFFWAVDLIVPVTMIVLGLIYNKHHPRKINLLYGYRTAQSMRSQETWDYANRRMGFLFVRIGLVLLTLIVISKIIVPVKPENLSLIHAGIGVLAFGVCILIIEGELRSKF